ncbi:drug/metabolite transporter (DMT)-like permease [Kitasatospora sp. MAA4]|uniref:DMT family transporter n=1 Tax=Kitasatospora sp. MAA4 TaxID=3035093 RepID=UPI002474AFE5|nr:DMT family transporter [Kitasatospora sp. MAA4]MDH6134007.1 drug/metabolite transporter (DMT)-like permease [Kitasatospora sp. MAA4]
MRTPSQVAPRGIVTDLPVLLVAVVWGSSYLAVKHLATPATVLPTLVLRFGLVLPFLAVIAWRGLRGLNRGEWLGGALLGGILGAIFLVETYGVVHTSATNAGLIISFTMVLTPLAESLVGRTPLPRAFVAAAGLSVVGVGLLTEGAGLRAPSAGDLLMLAAAGIRTVHLLAMSRTKVLRDTDPIALTWVQLATAAAIFVVVSPFAGPSPWSLAASYGPGQWADLLYLGLFCTLVAFLVQMWAVRATSPSRVSLLLGTEPLWAAVVGIVLGGDRLVPLAFCGGLLVLAGTAWGRRAVVPAARDVLEPLPA